MSNNDETDKTAGFDKALHDQLLRNATEQVIRSTVKKQLLNYAVGFGILNVLALIYAIVELNTAIPTKAAALAADQVVSGQKIVDRLAGIQADQIGSTSLAISKITKSHDELTGNIKVLNASLSKAQHDLLKAREALDMVPSVNLGKLADVLRAFKTEQLSVETVAHSLQISNETVILNTSPDADGMCQGKMIAKIDRQSSYVLLARYMDGTHDHTTMWIVEPEQASGQGIKFSPIWFGSASGIGMVPSTGVQIAGQRPIPFYVQADADDQISLKATGTGGQISVTMLATGSNGTQATIPPSSSTPTTSIPSTPIPSSP